MLEKIAAKTPSRVDALRLVRMAGVEIFCGAGTITAPDVGRDSVSVKAEADNVFTRQSPMSS
jgi:2-keto-3-deoxy-6-phosphogluconate aldolase